LGLQEKIRRHLILPYLYQQLPSEYAKEHSGGHLFAFFKPTGGLRPLLCGSLWRRAYAACAAHSLSSDAETHFTRLFPNFMQFAAGTQDGTVQVATMLSSWYDEATSAAPSIHVTGSLPWAENFHAFVEIDLKKAFNVACRKAAL
jgi:hypothetical protein